MDGTFFARATDAGEQWSQQATRLEDTDNGFAFEASFDDGPVTVTHDAAGWCEGADPNVLGR